MEIGVPDRFILKGDIVSLDVGVEYEGGNRGYRADGVCRVTVPRPRTSRLFWM